MKISLQNRQFRLWKYSISHSMLLIRSCKNASFSNNIDLYFADVKLIKFHQFFRAEALTSYTADEDILEECNKANIPFNEDQIFVFRGEQQKCYIIASIFQMEENTNEFMEVAF